MTEELQHGHVNFGNPGDAESQNLPEAVYLEVHWRDKTSVYTLAFLPHNPTTPYASWVRDRVTNERYWGHYYRTLTDAVRGYQERIRNRTQTVIPDAEPGTVNRG